MTKAILSFIFLGVAVASFVFYIKPTYDNAQTYKADIARYDSALEKTKEIQTLKRDLLTRYNLFAGDNLDRLLKMVPDHVDNVRLVLDLDGIASQYGLRVQNVSAEAVAKADAKDSATLVGGQTEEAYQSLTLQFEVVATYQDFLSLLHDLESSLRIVEVESISLTPYGNTGEGDASQDALYNFSIVMRTFWLK